MAIGKKQGIGIMILGLLLLSGGIIVLVVVPSWGQWIASYPEQIAKLQLPGQAAIIGQGMAGIFGPLMQQLGGYMKKAGYFMGSLLSLISLVITFVGIMIIKRSSS